jgi:hypothetical protein
MESKLAEKALEHFVIDRKRYQITPIVKGYINHSFKIADGGQPRYLLQHLNKNVFQDIETLMRNLESILPYLNHKDYASIDLMPTKARTPLYRDSEGEFWRLLTYVPESISYNIPKDRKIAKEAGRILGIFHRLLKDIPKSELSDTIPGFHSLQRRMTEFSDARKNASPTRLQKAKKWVLLAETIVNQIKSEQPSDLPIRICHNDTKLNNFLFSKKTGNALCLIDLDTVMPGYFHYDFGDALRTLVNPSEEDERDLTKISFNLPMADAFLEGLKESGLTLTSAEKLALPYGALLMPFLHGIRALTDYLNNDRYYQIQYPDQNLDRSISLFTVAQKVIVNREELSKSVERILGK